MQGAKSIRFLRKDKLNSFTFPPLFNNMKETIESLLTKRILILDGAMGTMIQKHDLEEIDFRDGAFKDKCSPRGRRPIHKSN